MRVVFLGTPEFAVPSLRALLASPFEVSAVFTQPDRPAGRGQRPQPPPVKLLAASAQVDVYQPEKIRSDENRALINSLKPDFIVVVAYGQILPGWLLRSAQIAAVNVHASLLPQYRGAAPVVWAILRGECITGVTTMLMDEQLDTGDILLKQEVRISENMTGGELAAVLSHAGATLLIPTLEGVYQGTITAIPQDHSRATYAPRLAKEHAWIDWAKTAAEIHNQIRAFNPWPLACTELHGQRLQILRSRVSTETAGGAQPPGTFLGWTRDGIRIGCGRGTALEVLETKPANRRPMSAREMAAGARLEPGTRFVSPGAAPVGSHNL